MQLQLRLWSSPASRTRTGWELGSSSPRPMLWLQAGSCQFPASQVSVFCHKPSSLTKLLLYKSRRNSLQEPEAAAHRC